MRLQRVCMMQYACLAAGIHWDGCWYKLQHTHPPIQPAHMAHTHAHTHLHTHTRERACTCMQYTQTHTWAHACTWTQAALQHVVHMNCNASMYMSMFASSSQQLKARDKKPFFHLAVLPHFELHEQATTRQCKSDRGWNRPLLCITSVMHPGSTSWAGHCAVSSCTGTHAAPPIAVPLNPHTTAVRKHQLRLAPQHGGGWLAGM